VESSIDNSKEVNESSNLSSIHSGGENSRKSVSAGNKIHIFKVNKYLTFSFQKMA